MEEKETSFKLSMGFGLCLVGVGCRKRAARGQKLSSQHPASRVEGGKGGREQQEEVG